MFFEAVPGSLIVATTYLPSGASNQNVIVPGQATGGGAAGLGAFGGGGPGGGLGGLGGGGLGGGGLGGGGLGGGGGAIYHLYKTRHR